MKVILKSKYNRIMIGSKVIDNSNLTNELYKSIVDQNPDAEKFFELIPEKDKPEKKSKEEK